VMPFRGPAVGSVRTGWRTREFDPWLMPTRAAAALDPNAAQDRLAEELIALPLADLDWTWVERNGAGDTFVHPHFGPACLAPLPVGPAR